jgi:membrane fusion protein (multidrug efflux system)
VKAFFSKPFQVAILLIVAALLGGVIYMRPRGVESTANGASTAATTEATDDEDGTGETAAPVEVIKPRHDPNFTISVTQPAYVDPYYRVDLRARVAGPVVEVTKDIGDSVKRGDELVTLDAPDLVQDVAKKEAVVKQRQSEREVARAVAERALADVDFAAADIKEREADVLEADATTKFRKQELERFEGLAKQDRAITENIVEERRKFYEAAAAASTRTRAAVEKARAALSAAQAKSREAKADEQLKDSLIEVAERDRKLSEALLSFATLTAPFDGKITRRSVDPGTFVQNSANSPGPALLTLERTDLVTVYSNIPDNYAPYVDQKTEATIEMSELPGVQIRGVVTRYAQSLQNPAGDRTMRVELDLYNRGPKEYRLFIERVKSAKPQPKGKSPRPQYQELKGGKLPVFPEVSKQMREKLGTRRLMPGMYGTMRLSLSNFRNAYLIPSQAVFRQGGKSYIYLLKGDTVHQRPVDVQVDDGVLAKVVVLENGERTRRRELNADDQIVRSNQGELSDGQKVKPTEVAW